MPLCCIALTLQAKYDFVEEMYKWSGASSPATILDVGCGIGGTSRYLAAKFPQAQVQGALPSFVLPLVSCLLGRGRPRCGTAACGGSWCLALATQCDSGACLCS